jgi:hypothetical protein
VASEMNNSVFHRIYIYIYIYICMCVCVCVCVCVCMYIRIVAWTVPALYKMQWRAVIHRQN